MLKNLNSLYDELRRDGVIICFSGPASQGLLEGLGRTLRREMALEEAGESTMHRVFSIFVEQMQNIMRYSSDKTPSRTVGGDGTGHGMVVVGREEGGFYVICGNKVSRSQSDKMRENIEYLGTLDRHALKEHYKAVRREGPENGGKGAGLGFIEMFRRASEPLECNVTPLDDDDVFFSIKAKGC